MEWCFSIKFYLVSGFMFSVLIFWRFVFVTFKQNTQKQNKKMEPNHFLNHLVIVVLFDGKSFLFIHLLN